MAASRDRVITIVLALQCRGKDLPSGSSVKIGTLSEEYRPYYNIVMTGIGGSTSSIAELNLPIQITIGPSGSVTIFNNSGKSARYICASFSYI